jgi:hypothetical protein
VGTCSPWFVVHTRLMSSRFLLVLLLTAGPATAADWETSIGVGVALGLDQPAIVVDHPVTLHLLERRVSIAIRLHGGMLFSQLRARVGLPPRTWWQLTAFPVGAAAGVRVRLVEGLFLRGLVGGDFILGAVNGDQAGGGGPTGTIELGYGERAGPVGLVVVARMVVLLNMFRTVIAIPSAGVGFTW